MTETTDIYHILRKIDVSEHIEKKNKLNYLSWAWALDTLLLNDPDATWEHMEPKIFQDGTVMVYCKVTAFGRTRIAYLPVMNHKNEPIKNPNAFQYNTAMQRCLAKAIALHGIGLYIYAGEDLPEGVEREQEAEEEEAKPPPVVPFTEREMKELRDAIADAVNDEQLSEAKKKARAGWKRMSQEQQKTVTAYIEAQTNEISKV